MKYARSAAPARAVAMASPPHRQQSSTAARGRSYDDVLEMLSGLITFKTRADGKGWRDAFENMPIYLEVSATRPLTRPGGGRPPRTPQRSGGPRRRAAAASPTQRALPPAAPAAELGRTLFPHPCMYSASALRRRCRG